MDEKTLLDNGDLKLLWQGRGKQRNFSTITTLRKHFRQLNIRLGWVSVLNLLERQNHPYQQKHLLCQDLLLRRTDSWSVEERHPIPSMLAPEPAGRLKRLNILSPYLFGMIGRVIVQCYDRSL